MLKYQNCLISKNREKTLRTDFWGLTFWALKTILCVFWGHYTMREFVRILAPHPDLFASVSGREISESPRYLERLLNPYKSP